MLPHHHLLTESKSGNDGAHVEKARDFHALFRCIIFPNFQHVPQLTMPSQPTHSLPFGLLMVEWLSLQQQPILNHQPIFPPQRCGMRVTYPDPPITDSVLLPSTPPFSDTSTVTILFTYKTLLSLNNRKIQDVRAWARTGDKDCIHIYEK